ncbi:MAG TPA: DUF4271 domain-containing protein [Phnomibacter sp.]|nr:DUF4271 domain-containing protein [Phnomibacter sp.]
MAQLTCLWKGNLLALLLLLASGLPLLAQDSLLVKDSSTTAKSDTITTTASVDTSFVRPAAPAIATVRQPDTTLAFFNRLNPYLGIQGALYYRLEKPFQPLSKDALFYWLAGAVLFLGIVRVGFSKYFSDMLRMFSQSSFRQKSIRDQLQQNRLASLLMNCFFFFSAGTFLYQLGQFKGWFASDLSWWMQSLLCIGFVAAVYMVKYLTIGLSGWLFGLSELADTYTFMVFLVNKIIGIMLLPASISLALGVADLQSVMVVASLFGLGFLFLYRYVLAIPMLRQHLRVIPFHFFIYFCAFEIVPVLLIYKWMLSFVNQ